VLSWVLGTGSQGNAVVLEADGARILVDAGLPIRTLVRRLAAIGVSPLDIEAVILTHEHNDHLQAAVSGARKYGWRILATRGTIAAERDLSSVGATAIARDEVIRLSTMEVATVPIPHDAVSPIAVVATARRTGIRTAVAYDLGCVTETVRRGLARLDVLIIESNHDEAMLRMGPYPPSVARRIAGPHGHLSNTSAADLVRRVAHRGLADVVLAHLSASCNEPGLAAQATSAALARSRHKTARVTVAVQDRITGPFGPGSSQLTLAL
jgi:phosphoribosyl 1,2-cyclic phosphodiesterase